MGGYDSHHVNTHVYITMLIILLFIYLISLLHLVPSLSPIPHLHLQCCPHETSRWSPARQRTEHREPQPEPCQTRLARLPPTLRTTLSVALAPGREGGRKLWWYGGMVGEKGIPPSKYTYHSITIHSIHITSISVYLRHTEWTPVTVNRSHVCRYSRP